MDKKSKKEVNERWRETELAEAVLQYLTEHPHAMDTLEGIAEWWLMRQQVRVSVIRLARVLHQLTERGVLEAVGAGANTQYHLKAGGRGS